MQPPGHTVWGQTHHLIKTLAVSVVNPPHPGSHPWPASVDQPLLDSLQMGSYNGVFPSDFFHTVKCGDSSARQHLALLHLPADTCHHLSDYSHLVSVKCYFIMVLICIFLMTDDVDHLFICPLAICISSLKNYLFMSLAWFWIGLFAFLLNCKIFNIFWLLGTQHIFYSLVLGIISLVSSMMAEFVSILSLTVSST